MAGVMRFTCEEHARMVASQRALASSQHHKNKKGEFAWEKEKVQIQQLTETYTKTI